MAESVAQEFLRWTEAAKPTTWTGAWVRHRLREAFEIERRLPNSGQGNGAGSAWPFPVLYQFADVVGWTDARDRVLDEWQHARGALPFEVSRMEEAIDWLAFLRQHPGEHACLVVWSKAPHWSLRRVVTRVPLSRSTFYRRVRDGSERIAGELKVRGVEVR